MIRTALALVLAAAMYCGSILVAYQIGFENGATTGFEAADEEQVRFARSRVRAITWQGYKFDHTNCRTLHCSGIDYDSCDPVQHCLAH